MTNKIVVLSTAGSIEQAQAIARALVEGRLAACVNILPGVQSVYHWQGSINQDAEVLLVIKSRAELFHQLAAEIKRIHTYEVPEIIALPVTAGSEAYLDWLDRETG